MSFADTDWVNGDNEHYLMVLSNPWYRTVVDLQDCVVSASHEFWRNTGAKHILLPITTGSISSPMGLGSDSTPVKVKLMGVDTYLADSMQFGLEYACRLSDNGAFYIMPSFRGEDCDRTHLA